MTKRRRKRTDGWESLVLNVGAKAATYLPVLEPMLELETCATLYEQDDFAERIVSTLVEDAMRQGFAFEDTDDESDWADAKALNDACKRWGLAEKVTEAAIWGRCFGGGFLMLGVTGAGRPEQPLEDDRIRPGALKFLDVYDRRDVIPHSYYRDPLEPKFGEVELYRIQPTTAVGVTTAVVHETRMIKFGGVLTTRRTKARNASFDNSALQCVFTVLQQSDLNWRSIGALMSDFAQGVYKIKDLIKILAQNEKGVLETRMRLMDQYRSSERAIVLDADKEDFERKTTPIAGAADLLDRTWQRLAAAAKMPVTRLIGISPAGLNATGEHDTINWYDRVNEYRQNIVASRLERAGRIIARSEGIDAPDSLAVCFPSLWQMSPMQEADRRLKVAQADAINIDKGMVYAEEAALSRFGRGKYSAETAVDLEARAQALEAKLKAATATTATDDKLELTPSDRALYIKVNEARAKDGFPPIEGPDGDLTLAQFKAKYAAVIAEAAKAEAGKTGEEEEEQAQGAEPDPEDKPEPPPKRADAERRLDRLTPAGLEGDAYAQALAARSQEMAARSLGPDLAKVREVLDAATSPQDLRERLAQAFEGMDQVKLAELTHKALILGHLAGRAAVSGDLRKK